MSFTTKSCKIFVALLGMKGCHLIRNVGSTPGLVNFEFQFGNSTAKNQGKPRRHQHKSVSDRKLGCVTLAYKQACYPLHHKVRRSKTWRHDCALDYFTLPWGYYDRSTCRQVAERRTWNYKLIMRGNSASALCSYHRSVHFNILCSDD